jgi:hypothetical protein
MHYLVYIRYLWCKCIIIQNLHKVLHNIHLMSAPEGNSLFCFLESLNVSRDKVQKNFEIRGGTKLNTVFPWETDTKYFLI